MQYILTQEELDALTPLVKLQQAKTDIEKLRILLVGEKCEKVEGKDYYGYCDYCPLVEANIQCGLYRNFSK